MTTGRRSPFVARLAGWTLGVTVLLVAIGGFTRGSGSGYGCEDRWPLCENGLLGGVLPRPEFHMVVEWTHRWFAAVSIALVVATAVYAWWRHRGSPTVTRGATAAVVAIFAQAGLGAVVVMTDLDADTVTLHLAVAMILLALLAFVTVESHFVDGRRPARATTPDRAWRRWLTGGAVGTYAVVMLGSLVHDRFVGPAEFPDGWPLVAGRLVPATTSETVTIHYAHRVAVAVVLVLLAYLAARAVRSGRPAAEVRLVHGALALFLVNIGLGAAHVFTRVQSTGLVVAHLLVASLTWTALVAAAAVARRADLASPARDVADEPREPARARS